MTDNEIIKALECCSSQKVNACDDCPFYERCYNNDEFIEKEAIDLINRQKAEIDRQKDHIELLEIEKQAIKKDSEKSRTAAMEVIKKQDAEIERLKKVVSHLEDYANGVADQVKAEAVKEFAERLKSFLAINCRTVSEDNPNTDDIIFGYEIDDVDIFIDNLVKEMVGEG
jgi:hypothetical protein